MKDITGKWLRLSLFAEDKVFPDVLKKILNRVAAMHIMKMPKII